SWLWLLDVALAVAPTGVDRDDDDDLADLDQDGLADGDQRTVPAVLAERQHLDGVDADHEGLLGLGGDDGKALQLVLIGLDLVDERRHRGVKLALASVQRGLGRGCGLLGLGGKLLDLRVATRLLAGELENHAVARRLDLDDDAIALFVIAMAGGRGNRT